eukprot:Ihof_evm2s460 gene=Ihof_evmTU2s460
MNAVIALCHFCELDGPSVLFCTQPYHSPYSASDITLGAEPQYRPTYFDRHADNQLNEELPHVTREPKRVGLTSHKSTNRCDACKSTSTIGPGYVTTDQNARVSYVSAQSPAHPTLFTVVRQACVRSLSSEICPGREGPIMFGDSKNGFVLSYGFSLRDIHARGFMRGYCIMCLMTDKLYLVNSFSFIVSQFRQVVDHLKLRANEMYEKDMIKYHNRPPNLTRNSTNRRYGSQPLRSLAELTNNKQLFIQLHRTFSWVLKSAGTRLTEHQLEGPPTISTNQSGILGSSYTRHFLIGPTAPYLSEKAFDGFFLRKEPLFSVGTGSMEKDTKRTIDNGKILTKLTDKNGSNALPLLVNLSQLITILGPNSFKVVLYHVLVGNQGSKLTVPGPGDPEPVNPVTGNLLGVAHNVSVPVDIDPSSYVILDVIMPSQKESNTEPETQPYSAEIPVSRRSTISPCPSETPESPEISGTSTINPQPSSQYNGYSSRSIEIPPRSRSFRGCLSGLTMNFSSASNTAPCCVSSDMKIMANFMVIVNTILGHPQPEPIIEDYDNKQGSIFSDSKDNNTGNKTNTHVYYQNRPLSSQTVGMTRGLLEKEQKVNFSFQKSGGAQEAKSRGNGLAGSINPNEGNERREKQIMGKEPDHNNALDSLPSSVDKIYLYK